MDNFAGRQFRIVLAERPDLWIGADNIDNCAVKQVITVGDMRKWSYKEGCLVLDDIWYSAEEGGKLVVRLDPQCTEWQIEGVEPGVYRIRLPGTNLAWSAVFEPKEPVIFSPVGSVDPKYQLLRFELLE